MQAVGQGAHIGDQFGRLMDLEIYAKKREVEGEAFEGMGTGVEQARIVVNGLEHSGGGRNSWGQDLDGRLQGHSGPVGVWRLR